MIEAPRHVLVAVERLQRWVDGFAERHGPFEVSPTDEGVLLTARDEARAWLSLPWLPGAPREKLTTFAVHANRPRRVGVLLVRRGGHAAGIFEGTDLVASKVGSSYVQGTTKAGGWSQQRYARRRENQTTAAWAEAADVVARILLPEAGSLEALVRGGDRAGVDAVLADPRLAPLAALPTGPLIDVPDPRLKVLEATPKRFRCVRIDLDP